VLTYYSIEYYSTHILYSYILKLLHFTAIVYLVSLLSSGHCYFSEVPDLPLKIGRFVVRLQLCLWSLNTQRCVVR
jgi:cbb3-type cytochrome oxidase subunit 1